MTRPDLGGRSSPGCDSGTRLVTLPSGRCSAARSRSHFTREVADVVEERRGLDVDLPVAGPAGALAGRAVGRDVAGVAAEAPLGDAVERVDARRRSRRTRRSRSRSVCTTTAIDVVGGERSGVAVDADVLEALRAVARFEHVAVDAGRGDHVGLERDRLLDVGRVGEGDVVLRDVAVVVEPLAVGERDLGAGRAEVRAGGSSR